MHTVRIQSMFLDEVKKRLPPNVSLADDLASVLDISRDSAYRRLRGETILSLDEAKAICDHYRVSLDSVLNLNSQRVSFNHWAVDHAQFPFHQWLSSIMSNLDRIARAEQKELLYSAKDLPIFNYFQSELLSEFKMYFWMKTVLGYPEYQNLVFRPGIIPRELLAMGKRIWQAYIAIPGIELWSDEAANVTLKQITFSYECGFVPDPAVARLLCDEYVELLRLVRHWAETGVKMTTGEKFSLYRNEILIGDNLLLFRVNGRRVVFVAYNTMSVLTSDDEAFGFHVDNYISNLLNRSVLISTAGERERNMFFNQIENRIFGLRGSFGSQLK